MGAGLRLPPYLRCVLLPTMFRTLASRLRHPSYSGAGGRFEEGSDCRICFSSRSLSPYKNGAGSDFGPIVDRGLSASFHSAVRPESVRGGCLSLTGGHPFQFLLEIPPNALGSFFALRQRPTHLMMVAIGSMLSISSFLITGDEGRPIVNVAVERMNTSWLTAQ